MTSTGYHDTGEEWAQKLTWRQDLISRDASVTVLLYNDSTDALSDSSDVGAITTEPTDGNYARQTLSLDGTAISLSTSSGDVRASGTVVFDTENTTGTVDAYAVIATFQSDVVNSESSENNHLITSAGVGTHDLGADNIDQLDVKVNLDLN